MSHPSDHGMGVAALAFLVALLAVVGMFIVPSHWTSIWGDREFTGWVAPIATRMAAGQVLYADGAHSPMSPLPFVLMYLLFGHGALWIYESFLNFFFQALTIVSLYLGVRRSFPRPVGFLAALGSVPIFFSLPKTILFDAQTQFLVALLAVTVVHYFSAISDDASGRSERPSHGTLRVLCPILLPIATAACILSKQSTGSGAFLGTAIALIVFPRASSLPDRLRRAATYASATVVSAGAVCLLSSGWMSPRGLVVDVFLTGSEPKGGPLTLIQNLGVYTGVLVRNMLSIAFTVVVGAGTVALSWDSGRLIGSGPESGTSGWRTRSRSAGALGETPGAVIGICGALAGAITIVLQPPQNAVMGFHGYSRVLGVLSSQFLLAGLFACLVITVGTALRRGAPRSANDSPFSTIAVLTTVTFPAAIMHNLSVKYFRWTYDNNPFIVVALIVVLYFVIEVPARLMPGRQRLSKVVAALCVVLIQMALWTEAGFGNQIGAIRGCTETWPEIDFLAGAKLQPGAAGMRELVHDVRNFAKPNDTVLLLPGDPNVEAWFERPRPHLSSAIIFVDQYWDRYVDSDFERLQADLPRVIVIGPRRNAPLFQRVWHPDTGATRLIDRVTREILPKYYRLGIARPIVFQGKKDFMDVYVRLSP